MSNLVNWNLGGAIYALPAIFYSIGSGTALLLLAVFAGLTVAIHWMIAATTTATSLGARRLDQLATAVLGRPFGILISLLVICASVGTVSVYLQLLQGTHTSTRGWSG